MSDHIVADIVATANYAAGLVDFAEAPGCAGGVVFVMDHWHFFSVNQMSGDGGWQGARVYRSRLEAEFAAVLLADLCQAEVQA